MMPRTYLLWLIISLTDSRLVPWLTSILCLTRSPILWLRSSTWCSTSTCWSLCSDLRLYSFCLFCLAYRPVVLSPLSTIIRCGRSPSLRCPCSCIRNSPSPCRHRWCSSGSSLQKQFEIFPPLYDLSGPAAVLSCRPLWTCQGSCSTRPTGHYSLAAQWLD